MKPLILICSRDAEFYLFLSHVLQADGFTSELAGSAGEAVQQTNEREPRAIVLDCQPWSGGGGGSSICARLKSEVRTGDVPIVGLIAPGAEDQYLDLLKAGIDESFVRPFAPARLLFYLRTRLAMPPLGPGGGMAGALTYGDLEMRPASHRVRCNGYQLDLGPIEFKLLCHLIKTPGKVFSRDELIAAAWPDNIHVGARTVDVHISRLRKALSPHNIIRTVRSAGYALEESETCFVHEPSS